MCLTFSTFDIRYNTYATTTIGLRTRMCWWIRRFRWFRGIWSLMFIFILIAIFWLIYCFGRCRRRRRRRRLCSHLLACLGFFIITIGIFRIVRIIGIIFIVCSVWGIVICGGWVDWCSCSVIGIMWFSFSSVFIFIMMTLLLLLFSMVLVFIRSLIVFVWWIGVCIAAAFATAVIIIGIAICICFCIFLGINGWGWKSSFCKLFLFVFLFLTVVGLLLLTIMSIACVVIVLISIGWFRRRTSTMSPTWIRRRWRTVWVGVGLWWTTATTSRAAVVFIFFAIIIVIFRSYAIKGFIVFLCIKISRKLILEELYLFTLKC